MNSDEMTQHDAHDSSDWQAALDAALSDAIEHLQLLIFEEGWEAVRATTESDEEALRESVARYERELARLFGMLRASGALPDAVAWSALKADYRRAALDAETEISLRTALESGFYAAEPVPLGDHATYLNWVAALKRFLALRAMPSADRPAPDAAEDARLQWAYEILAPLEDHDTFHAAFTAWLRDDATDRSDIADVINLQERLLAMPRFDLVLNSSLRWLATTAGS